MNIYSAEQIKAWDAYTIRHEPIASIDLMERAAQKCVEWLLVNFLPVNHFKIFCAKGNNGGDGLAIARLVFQKNRFVEVFILGSENLGTEDFQFNLQRLRELPVPVHFIQSQENFPTLQVIDVVIDALFGSGLNKPLHGLTALLVEHLNKAKSKIVAVDLPSGLFADRSSKGNVVVEADDTLTFQVYKKAFLVAENAPFIGTVHLLDIGLHPDFAKETNSNETLVTAKYVKNIFQPRKKFSHKGNHGHALVIGGSYGKMGAMVLSVSACLKSGAGLVTTYIPRCGYVIMQTSAPEAMVLTDDDESMITRLPGELDKYSAIGIGPGMGSNKLTREAVIQLLKSYNKPLVIDADGLNSLALQTEAMTYLPSCSILTPHPKEFERLFGVCENDFERIEKAKQKAVELNIIIVLKGHHTVIALPDGNIYFNSTGNAGMAKGGSGDVLTGMITALCAQLYSPEKAAILGVYLHGLAGDLAAKKLSAESMVASDLISFLSDGFTAIKNIVTE